jgi:hypothetical protein
VECNTLYLVGGVIDGWHWAGNGRLTRGAYEVCKWRPLPCFLPPCARAGLFGGGHGGRAPIPGDRSWGERLEVVEIPLLIAVVSGAHPLAEASALDEAPVIAPSALTSADGQLWLATCVLSAPGAACGPSELCLSRNGHRTT